MLKVRFVMISKYRLILSNLLLANGIIEYEIKKTFKYLTLKNENLLDEQKQKSLSEERLLYKNWYSQGDILWSKIYLIKSGTY